MALVNPKLGPTLVAVVFILGGFACASMTRVESFSDSVASEREFKIRTAAGVGLPEEHRIPRAKFTGRERKRTFRGYPSTNPDEGPGSGPGLRATFEFAIEAGYGEYGLLGRGDRQLALSWADADGDGDLDLTRFRNNGDGTFTPFTGFDAIVTDWNFHGSSWADYDADGDPDLMLLGYGETARAFLLRNDGNGNFSDVTESAGVLTFGFGETPVWGDYDGDGDVDLFAPYYSHVAPFRSFLYENRGDGTFHERAVEAGVDLPNIPIELRPEGAHWADYDGDGDLDLFCAHHLFENDGEGVFTDVAGEVGIPVVFDEGTEFVDFDNDGDLDLYVRAIAGGMVFENEENEFTNVASEIGIPAAGFSWGDRWADVDNDGDLDLLYFRRNEPAMMLLNSGDGTFFEDRAIRDLNWRSGISAFGDFDVDGDLDVVMGSKHAHLWINQLDQSANFPGSYLRVRVLDENGHQTMHGSTVRLARVDSNSPYIQTRVVDGGSGYLNQNMYETHFGVLPTGIYALEVSFPSHPEALILVDGDIDARLDALRPQAIEEGLVRVYRDGRVRIPEPFSLSMAVVALLGVLSLRSAGKCVPALLKPSGREYGRRRARRTDQ